jgi:hypothetical protein
MTDFSHHYTTGPEVGAPDPQSGRNIVVTAADPIFTLIFFMEFVVKVTAVGFYNKCGTAYIKDPG